MSRSSRATRSKRSQQILFVVISALVVVSMGLSLVATFNPPPPPAPTLFPTVTVPLEPRVTPTELVASATPTPLTQ